MSYTTNTYTDTGQKTLIELNPIKQYRFFIQAGSTDVYSVDIQLTGQSSRAALPDYKNISGNAPGRAEKPPFKIGLTITTNNSGNIIFELVSDDD